MDKTKNFSILIPDAENPAFLKYIIYALSHYKDIEIHLLSQKPWSPMRFSSYLSSFTVTDATEYNEKWIESVYDLAQKKNIDVIFPTGILTRSLLSKYKDHPISHYMLLPDSEIFDIANSKGKLAEYLNQRGLPHPITLFKRKNEFLSSDEISNLKFPILMKPTNGRGGKGIQLFSSKQELKEGLNSFTMNDDYVFQQYIEDQISYGCSVLCKDGEIQSYSLFKFEQRYGDMFSFSAEQLFIDNKEIYEITRKLMSNLNWSGVANVDFIYNHKNNKYYILEINPRYWSTLSLSVKAGINLPYLEILSILSLPLPTTEYKLERFYMVKYGLKMFLKSLLSRKLDFSYIKRTNAADMLKDPLPIFIEQIQGLYVKYKRK